MDWIFLVIVVILDVVVTLIHTIALIILIFLKQGYVTGSQKFLLIALCSTELTYAVIDIGLACGTLFDMIWSMVVVCIVLESTDVAFFIHA